MINISIPSLLEKLDFVMWDRFVEVGHFINIFGWIDWSDLMKNIPLIVGALLIITLVGAFKK